MQIGKGQAAHRRAQHGEQSSDVRRLEDDPGQRQQILHYRPVTQGVQLHRAVGHSAANQRRQDLFQMAAGTDDDGRPELRIVAMLVQGAADQIGRSSAEVGLARSRAGWLKPRG